MWWFIAVVALMIGIWIWYEVRSWNRPMTKEYEQPGWRGDTGGVGDGSGGGL